MTVQLAPEVDQLIVDALLACTELTDLVGVDGAYTIVPAGIDFALGVVRVTQVDSILATRGWLDGNVLQVDAWAKKRSRASLIGRTARACLDRLTGTQPRGGVITGVATSGWRYEPDSEFTTAMPRYLFTATVHAHPSPNTGS